MDLEKEIEEIKERNRRVEADKAWETSGTRTGFIALVIYAVAVALLYFIGAAHFLVNGLVPAFGYLLSVQSLPFLKRWWMRVFWGGGTERSSSGVHQR